MNKSKSRIDYLTDILQAEEQEDQAARGEMQTELEAEKQSYKKAFSLLKSCKATASRLEAEKKRALANILSEFEKYEQQVIC